MKNNKLNKNQSLKSTIRMSVAGFSLAICSGLANATIVQIETPLGNFEVNLYDEKTPETVNNFLNYVNSGAYNNSIIHRSVTDFVIQGGGFSYQNSWPAQAITTNAPVINEPVYSNVKGTIAMAKRSGAPNSATSQWFINLADNSKGNAQLDSQNGGFTVFGEVTGDGMAIIEQIAALPTYNFSGAFNSLPLQNYGGTGNPDETHLVINQITVIDGNTDTAAGLNPPLNTSINTPTTPTTPKSSGGGAAGFGWILAMLGVALWRNQLNTRT
ncbi:peptidylprolyl isomerase [Aliikangiella maris]|uniref:Peptidyl-prolyl cis-trans isomerase n=2 Tax=Aliikangiella maris TaxID=3162458 RepID=A0ABV3MK89_9GAMM